MTIDEMWDNSFPKANRFMVKWTGYYPTINGGLCSQACRRFLLADCASDTLAVVTEEITKSYIGGNYAKNISVEHVPQAACYTLGYFRFGRDIRNQLTNSANSKTAETINP